MYSEINIRSLDWNSSDYIIQFKHQEYDYGSVINCKILNTKDEIEISQCQDSFTANDLIYPCELDGHQYSNATDICSDNHSQKFCKLGNDELVQIKGSFTANDLVYPCELDGRQYSNATVICSDNHSQLPESLIEPSRISKEIRRSNNPNSPDVGCTIKCINQREILEADVFISTENKDKIPNR
ncbi:hypothetical protein RF11_04936 [Thelohanellus kitauei]|uniref:Uncharacterized protein n=1 Tax=Thelohanellus kitauei TaxID=669202 RepID=A0A0C2N2I2_THEKT|nr:hypothetical protein RF11_04936 [Thelohanellus kitauei]